MTAHRHIPQFLRVAYGCMACDGEIDPLEVSCLRSIAIQMGWASENADADMQAIQTEFAEDAEGMLLRVKESLKSENLSHIDAEQLFDLLVQIVEADGSVRPSEIRYIRNLAGDIGLDIVALRKQHPEWRNYLAEGIHTASGDALFPDALAALSDSTLRPSSE